MKIDKNSYGTLLTVYLICAGIMAVTFVFCGNLAIKVIVSVFMTAFAVWQTLFFRVPVRYAAGDGNKVTAVADGKIVIIDKVFEPEFLKRECIKISTYMDFWDVHANFWPVSGVVTYFNYHPGKHLLAFKSKASEDNEHTCVAIRTASGQDVFFKQIAGTFARRIVSYAKPGMKVNAGKQCGIIKFGSRVDLFVPLEAKIETELQKQAYACETVLAVLD